MQSLPGQKTRRSAAGKQRATSGASKAHPWSVLDATLLLLLWSILQQGAARPPDLEELFKALYDRLFWTAVQVFQGRGSKNPEEDAHEAVQEWILKMLDGSIAGYNFRTPFYVYAYTILVNACLTIGRKTVRHHADPLPVDLASRADEAGPAAERNEASLILRGETRTLPMRERRALIAKYWLDEKTKTAAARLGVTESTFNRLTHQGRERLRGRLAQWPGLCRPF